MLESSKMLLDARAKTACFSFDVRVETANLNYVRLDSFTGYAGSLEKKNSKFSPNIKKKVLITEK